MSSETSPLSASRLSPRARPLPRTHLARRAGQLTRQACSAHVRTQAAPSALAWQIDAEVIAMAAQLLRELGVLLGVANTRQGARARAV